MFYAGIDAHMKSSTIRIVDRKGRKVSSSTVMTSAEGFAAGLGRWARRGLQAAVEASGITPWVCQLLKDIRVKVVVVNPHRMRLIAESRKKSDRVDAETLAELLRLGGLPEVHQPSLEARRLRTELSVRRQLVRQRTGLINQARGLLRGWGVMLPARFFQARGGWKDLEAKKLHWLILDESGKPARMARNLATLCPALAEVQAYYKQLTERFVRDWDFDGHKLDNIYTMPMCYNPKHHHKSPYDSVYAMG